MIKRFLLTIVFLIVSAFGISAQTNAEAAILNSQDQFFNVKNRSVELERMKREANKRTVSENFTLNFPLIKKDFEQIQKINGEMLGLTTDGSAGNYAAAIKLVSEINQRAVRLHSNLFAIDSETKKEAKNKPLITEQKNLKLLFQKLDEGINNFVHNAIFQNMNLVNSNDSLKAQKDLETVINVSKAITIIIKN